MTPARTRTVPDVFARLTEANRRIATAYPGERGNRQPVHTVYGGAHLFTHDIAHKLGAAALRSLQEFAPEFGTFARAIGLAGHETVPHGLDDLAEMRRRLAEDPERVHREHRAAWLAHTVYQRVITKLESEPVEDYRIDFEDGYGYRSDDEEDHHAAEAGRAVANGVAQRTLPPFIGIRIKPFTEELGERSLRTLERFVDALAATEGTLPPNFVVTLPKITAPEQVETLVEVLELIEATHQLPPGAIMIELMIETPQSVLGVDGRVALPALVAAARGRCRGAHFGTYDYTAGLSITAQYQQPQHPACDFARHVVQVALAGTGVTISDGATTVMPVPVHRAAAGATLSPEQIEDNVRAVHHAWRAHYEDVRSSLRNAYYQGWDLNPAQLPTRYAAVFAFFLEARAEAAERLRRFVDNAAQATRLGTIFDDAATGQGLLNFFMRGINCGALTEEEALATGLTLAELRSRSFVKIMAARRANG
ncbi:MAG TPA: phosphoenolpyruvate kinase [Candidatus Eisenbacteria bacterium]|nr:phosphoenolpyruvate kinase [Candidatus Eisenbacteria bacterium]